MARDYGDLQSELTTKALDTFDTWVAKHAVGKITDRELMILADGLYDTIQGLVPWEVADVIYKVRNEMRDTLRARLQG